jgi:hypothetical protein
MRIVAILSICSCLLSCYSRKGFFYEMSPSYVGTALPYYGDVFEKLKTKIVDDGNSLEISCEGFESLIPFCGHLEFRNDSIFYANNDDKIEKLFMVFGERLKTQRVLEYSSQRIDKVKFIGMKYRSKTKDSVAVYQFNPVKGGPPLDGDYLKYVAVKRGGIKLLGFSSGGGEINIELSATPHVIR